jgi:glycosyltransferase involved in cell wall biosynthesis
MKKTKISPKMTIGGFPSLEVKHDNHLVSVIMTFYNAEKFIAEAFTSVVNQVTSKNNTNIKIEFVIVDDKSEDSSREIIEELTNEFNKTGNKNILINVVEPEKNLGCGGARKFGIEHSSGAFLMFLDADDYYIHNDFVMRSFESINASQTDIVEWGMVMKHPDGSAANVVAPQQMIIENNSPGAVVALFKDNLIKFNVWTKMYRREIIESREYSSSRVFEDVRTTPYWVFNAKRILIMPSCEVNYRAASGSIIREDNMKTRLGTITAIAELFEDFKQYKDVLKAMYQRAMVDLTAVLHGHSEENDGYNEMNRLNTYMLKYIYPDKWMQITYNPDVPEYLAEQEKFLKNQ